ncbi:hypothetical protein LTR53_010217, partial [Teratosphaeriaceae sp. CCFEE 6253]
ASADGDTKAVEEYSTPADSSKPKRVTAPRKRKTNVTTVTSTDGDTEAVQKESPSTVSLKPKRVVKAKRQAKVEAQSHASPEKPEPRRKRAAAKKTPATKAGKESGPTPESTANAPKPKRPRMKALTIPPRLLPPTGQKHSDLQTFLAYASRSKLDVGSTVYKGTHFEYTVAAALQGFNLSLQRTGRSNDLGIDLVGHWSVPTGRRKLQPIPVIVQCKASPPTPAMIRELEGAYTGAPAGWRGDGVLALLANVRPSTKGVREAVQRSRLPLGVLQITREGEVKQLLWNGSAAEAGLAALGVAVRYASKRGGVLQVGDDTADDGDTTGSIGLTWMGEPWLPAGAHSTPVEAEASLVEA